MEPNVQSDRLEFQYKCQSGVDINTLLTSQFHYAAILTEIKNFKYPDIDLKIKVQGFRSGSLGIEQWIDIIAVAGQLIFSDGDYIGNIFKIFKEYLDIRKLLKGEKPTTINNIDNSVHLTYNVSGQNNLLVVSDEAFALYQKNFLINKATMKNAEALINDDEIDGIRVIRTSDNSELLSMDRSEFRVIALRNPYLDIDTNVKKVENAILVIKKLDVNPQKHSKWCFILDGKPINATIEDEAFLRKVAAGIKFGNGDRLKANLTIYQKLDPETGDYNDDRFVVDKVSDIIYRDVQTRMFDDQEKK